ncbi:tRNA wybutosine-synthesizing protein 4 isoform X4 [Hyperolius riggenbachi]|uniref:tRNA wybutosine-synthesizing protein 4 isoform X4 n=1 Tax=Hyperolius riggenbachi TaxID=752182 RepID=UPI0035A2F59D
MMKNDGPVQKTNDFSTLSKASAAAAGYIPDLFQKCFVSRTCRRAPLIHRGYWLRSQAITHCIREFLQDTELCPHRQVLSLGCGFDSLYFRMCREESVVGMTSFWEVDFPAVVKRKRQVIEQTEELRSLLVSSSECSVSVGGIGLLSRDYKLLGVDLSDISALDSALDDAGLTWLCPTLVLAEVVLCYMEPERSTEVIGWAGRRLHNARFVLYEQFSPCDPFGQVMMNHFVSLNSALRSVVKYPQLEEQVKRFLQKGWEKCRMLDMNEFFSTCVPDSEKLRIESLEQFDEFEELHLKCSHYFILAASRGVLADCLALQPICCDQTGQQYVFVFGGCSVASELQEDVLFLQTDDMCWMQVHVEGVVPSRCHSHSACAWKGGAVLSGGLLQSGLPTGSIYLLLPQDQHFTFYKLDTSPPLTPRYSHTSHVIGDKLILVGGVWIHRRGIPGLSMVDLLTGHVREFELYTVTVDWPLMLHAHSSVLLPDMKTLMLLGGGGTCFSFGTHLNLQPVVLDLPPCIR